MAHSLIVFGKMLRAAAVIGFQLNFNTLAKAAIMGLYKR
jgi:hypothetical protein